MHCALDDALFMAHRFELEKEEREIIVEEAENIHEEIHEENDI